MQDARLQPQAICSINQSHLHVACTMLKAERNLPQDLSTTPLKAHHACKRGLGLTDLLNREDVIRYAEAVSSWL